ncbi:ATP-binding protein [Blastopirellula marina]|uniref:ATP-binding protein n=1 Tax=Blastopirellula marina TaxID=124 RepID=A0A2S8EZK8_9BACT|nr:MULTISPECIES: ATP-binding protein [Pirellulaceae]PQO25311.1 ATP-binding protein [Blastopirellula marina]RCS41744.1 ATP-binding protein [Bremerella cremea]
MGDDNNWLWSSKETIPSDTAEGQRLIKELLTQLERAEWAMHDSFGIHLAAEEAIVNAIKHGNKQDPNKSVEVDMRVGKERVLIHITDEGPGFKPADVPDPTLDENLDVPSGRGVMLIKAYMTEVSYNEKGNSVKMVKNRSA